MWWPEVRHFESQKFRLTPSAAPKIF